VAILDADKEGFLRSAWSLIQVIGRAARNIGGEVVMYADRTTESMHVAIEETNRRRAVQEAYNTEHGITPTTIVKEIRDINDRLAAVARAPGAYGAESGQLTELSQAQVEKLIGQLEAEMRAAAKQLEFERAAALRDEIQDIRRRVLEEDASVAVLRAAERAAAADGSGGRSGGRTGSRAVGRSGSRTAADSAGPSERAAAPPDGRPAAVSAKPSERAAARKAGERRGRRDLGAESVLEVTQVTVLPAGDEPLAIHEGPAAAADEGVAAAEEGMAPTADAGTAADVFPGIKDSHEDFDESWLARWLDRPTWDRRVTPNVIKRSGTRPKRRR
jgi:hypothetical protein